MSSRHAATEDDQMTMLPCVKAYVAAVEIHCPKCQKEITPDSGSLFWLLEELPPAVIGCPSCGKDYRLPQLGFLKPKVR